MLDSALPFRQFLWWLSTGNMGSSAAAGLSQPGPLRHSTCQSSTYHSILAEPLSSGSQAAAAVEPQSNFNLNLLGKFKINQVYLQVDPKHFEFQHTVTFSILKFKKNRVYKFETWSGTCTGSQARGHCTRQSCDDVLWSWILGLQVWLSVHEAARLQCPVLATNWGQPK